ncbi:unnamed protein product [Laminaria digitata]
MFPDAFVAAFSPGTILDDPMSITHVAPIKYQFITEEQPYTLDERSGETEAVESLRFRLLNLRDVEGYRFGLFKGGVENPVLVAKTAEAVKFARPFEVLQLHLALTSEVNSMRVSWVTGHASQAPAVRFREAVFADSQPGETQPARWQETSAESSLSYHRTDMCGAPATTKGFHDPGLLHSAVLTDLIPGKPYEYEAGDVDAQEWGAPAFFYAPPASLSSPSSTSFSPPPPASQSLQRLGSQTDPIPPVVVSLSTKPSTADLTGSGTNEQGQGEGSNAGSGPASGGGDGGGNVIRTSTSARTSVSTRTGDSDKEDEVESGNTTAVVLEAWGPEAVKVAIFGDMGTAEVDGTLDAGHTNEPPSIRTVGILKDQLGAGAQPVGGEAGGEAGQADNAAPEPQLGLVLHIGDLSYARGYDAQWDEYMDQIEPVASRVPWMVGMGNHERDFPTTSKSATRSELSYFTGTDSGGDCGVPTAFRFRMPGEAGEVMADSPWYGFDFGPVHFTVISTEHDFTPGSKQHTFVEGDLSSVDRAKTPWLVFAGHRPMYVSSGGEGAGDCEGAAALEEHCANDQPVAKLLRDSFEPLLIEHEVDLGVYGHHHSYQRTCKVLGEVCKGVSSQSPAVEGGEGYVAPVHVVLGMAGMGLSQNMASPRPEWVEYATDREFGLGMLVADRSKLRLSFILDTDGQVADEMMLTRGQNGQMNGGGSSLAHERLTLLSSVNSGRDNEEEEEETLRRTKEKAKVIGAGRARRAHRVT